MNLADLHGLISPEVGERLAALAAQVRAPACIVEVGSYCGKSTCYLASRASVPVFAVDPWDSPGNVGGRFGFDAAATRERFEAQVRAMGYEDRITPFRAFSCGVASIWLRPVGLLYVDGSHTEKDVYGDFAAWLPRLAPGAVVAFDDYRTERNPGVERAIVRIAKEHPAIRWEPGPAPLLVAVLP